MKKKGFTLVEVIVVLVILAILAAIAIPALTGYIDKAKTKKYISHAREGFIAFETMLNLQHGDYGITAYDITSAAGANSSYFTRWPSENYDKTVGGVTYKAVSTTKESSVHNGTLPGVTGPGSTTFEELTGFTSYSAGAGTYALRQLWVSPDDKIVAYVDSYDLDSGLSDWYAVTYNWDNFLWNTSYGSGIGSMTINLNAGWKVWHVKGNTVTPA